MTIQTTYRTSLRVFKMVLTTCAATTLLTGCGSFHLWGEDESSKSTEEAPAQSQTQTQSQTLNSMTVSAAQRKERLVCVVKDEKNSVEALERAIEEGVKATGVSVRVVTEGDDVTTCNGILAYGIAVKDGALAGLVFQMNEGSRVALRATGPAEEGKLSLHKASSYAADFVLHWLQPRSTTPPATGNTETKSSTEK